MSVNERTVTPAQAALYGLAAGFAATVILSGLTRIPVLREHAERASLRARSTAEEDDPDASLPMSPGVALLQTSGPGPEGAAGLFAAKIASGLFGRDLGKHTRRWGRAVHFSYGSFWGLVYGVLQTRTPRRPAVAGTAHGLFMWTLGPALLAPAMNLMPHPSKAPRVQTAVSLAAHVIYGVATGRVFNALMGAGSSNESSAT